MISVLPDTVLGSFFFLLLHGSWLVAAFCCLGLAVLWRDDDASARGRVSIATTFLIASMVSIPALAVLQWEAPSPIRSVDVAIETGGPFAAPPETVGTDLTGSTVIEVMSGGAPTWSVAGTPLNLIPIRTLGDLLRSVLFVAYVLGALFMVARLIVDMLRSRRLAHTGAAPRAPTSLRLWKKLRPLGRSASVEFLVSDAALSPMLVGGPRPVILVPDWLDDDARADDLLVALTHEFEHLRRRDHIWVLAQRLAECVFFFHPLVWTLSRRLSLRREVATDLEATIRVPGGSPRYASALLNIAERLSPALDRRGLAAVSNQSGLAIRIAVILKPQAPTVVRPRSMAISALVLLTSVGLAFGIDPERPRSSPIPADRAPAMHSASTPGDDDWQIPQRSGFDNLLGGAVIESGALPVGIEARGRYTSFEIIASPDGDLHIDVYGDAALGDGESSLPEFCRVRPKGRALRISDSRGESSRGSTVLIRLRVPTGHVLDVNTFVGEILLVDPLADLSARTWAGEIRATASEIKNWTLRSALAPITLDADTIESAHIHAGSSDIHIFSNQVRGTLDVETGSGDLHIDIGSIAASEVRLTSNSGTVEGRIGAIRSDASVTAGSKTGRVDIDGLDRFEPE